MKRKLLCLLLCISMILPNVPIAVHADEAATCEHMEVSEDGTVSGNGVCEICSANEKVNTEEKEETDQKEETGQKEDGNVQSEEKKDSEQSENEKIVSIENEDAGKSDTQETKKQQDSESGQTSQENKKQVSGNAVEEEKKEEGGISSNNVNEQNSVSENEVNDSNISLNEGKEVKTNVMTLSFEHEGLGSVNDVVPKRLRMVRSLLAGNVWDDTSNLYYGQLDDNSKAIYDILKNAYQQGVKMEPIALNLDRELTNIPQEGITETNKQQISSEINREIGNIVNYALLALLYDYPEMSWLVNTGGKTSYSIDWSTSAGKTTYRLTNVVYTLGSGSNTNYTKNQLDTAINKSLEEINEKLSVTQGTNYDKIKAIHDYICETVSYVPKGGNLSEDKYQTVHSALLESEGVTVCAGYAKAFKVLCNQYGIPCILVSGQGNGNNGWEAHMWNYVKLNGSWYAVDCTWDDQNSVLYDFFLVGGNTKASNFNDATFDGSHQASGQWSNDIASPGFAYPVLSTEAYAQSSDATALSTVYLSTTGMDSSSGEETAPVKTLEKALEKVKEGGTIIIQDSTTIKRDDGGVDGVLNIPKSVMIQGGEIVNERGGIVLGGDVTFKNTKIALNNSVRNAIIANGHTLVLESVQSTGTNDMHLFCGIITEPQTTYPQAGSEGKVVVKGSNTKIGNIYAGNFSDLGAYRLNGALTGNETKESHFTGNSTIIIDNTAVGTFGEIYAYGARENREGGFPNEMWTDNNDEGILNIEEMFTVNGKVIIQLHGRQITKISGASDKKAHVVFNSDTLIEGLVFSRIGTLEVNGQLQPSHFDEGLNIVLNSGGKLDLTKFSFGIPTIGNFTGAKTKETAGILLIDENYNETPNIPDTMTVSGIIQGYTELRTNYPSSDTTSGVVTEGHAYVIGTSTNSGEEFIFKPYETQTAISLKYENGTWTAKKSGEETVYKPTSFSFGKKSESITKTKINESGISIPIEYEFDDPNAVIAGVPLKIKVTYGSQFANATMKTDDIYDGYVVDACNMEIYISGEDNLCIVNNGKNINASSNPYKIEVSVETKNGLIIETFTLTVTDDTQNSVPDAIFNPPDTNDKGWYAGLKLRAPDGYTISKTENGNYSNEIEVEDGEYSNYNYWLKDTQGKPVEKTITELKVDGTSPDITKVEVSEVTATTAKVTVEARDSLSGLNGQSYSLYLSNGLSDSGVTVGNFVGNASGGSFAISGMRVDQTYTFELAVEDNAGSGVIKSNIEITPGKTNISTGQLKLKSGISYIYGENGNGGYDWKPKSGQLLLSLNGQTIPLDDTDFEYTYSNNINAGDSAQVTVTVKDSHGTYAGSVTGTFTIGRRPIIITPKQQTIRNGNQIQTGIDQVQVTNLVSGHSIGSIILSQDNTNKVITASSAVVMDNNGGEVTQNYDIRYKSGSLTILNPKITITPSSNIVYDGNAIIIGTSGTQNDVTYQLKECESPTVTWYNTTASGGKGEKLQEAPKDAGTYIVSVSAEVINQLGTISEEKQVTIKKAPLTATIGNQSIVYGGSFAVSSGKVIYTGFVNNESQSVVSGTPVYSTNYSTFGNVGTYSINANMNNVLAQNYEITAKSGILTVTPLPISVTWNNHTDRTYGDGKQVTATITNLVNNDQVGVTVSGGNATEVGTHTAKLTGLSGVKAGNYTISGVANTQSYSIEKAAAPTNVVAERNVKWSQEGNQTFNLSDFTLPVNIKNPQITVVTKNNKTIDSQGIFSGNQTVANNKVIIPLTKPVSYQAGMKGIFDVTITSSTHKDITAEIILFIVDRDVVDEKVAVSVSNVTYGQTPVPKGSFSGTKGNNPVEECKYSKDGITFESLNSLKNASGFLPTGDYSVQYTYSDDGQIGIKTAAFRVEKKALQITFTVQGITKEYDGTTALPTGQFPTLIIKEVVGNEQPKLVGTGIQFAYDNAQAGEGKTIQATGITLDTSEAINNNYTVENTVAVTGATITPKKVTVTPKTTYTKQYGTKDPVFEYQVTGMIGSDVLEGTLEREAGEDANKEYPYIVSNLKNSNYLVELQQTASKFTITKAEANLTMDSDLIAQKAGSKVKLTVSAKHKRGLEAAAATQPKAVEVQGVTFVEKSTGVFEGEYTIPQGAKVNEFITVKASMKDPNYQDASTEVKIKVIEEEMVALPTPQEKPESNGNNQGAYRLAMEKGISKIPEAFEKLEHLDTVEEIVSALKIEIKKKHSEITDATTAIYDVVLWYHPGDDNSVWVKADKTYWPKSGKITVVLPYPEGTGKNTHNFNVTHMFTVEMNNNKPGTFEYPQVTKTDQGISFQVSGLSPITLGWTKIQEAPAPNPGSGNSTGGSSDSSEDSSSATTTTVIKRQDVKKEEAKATDTTAVAVAQEPAKQKNTKVTVKKEEKEVADNNVVSEKPEATQQTEDAVKEITEEVQEIEGIEEASKVPQDTTQKVQEETKSSFVLWIAAIVALAAAGVVFFILWKNKKNEEA